MRARKAIRIALLSIFLLALVFVSSASAAVYVRNSWTRFTATAGESLALGDVVCIASSDGKAYRADADNPARRPAVGIAGKAAGTNAALSVTVIGILDGYTTLTKGAPAYLSATAGEAIQTAPANYVQEIGRALTATRYYFDFTPARSSITVDSTAHTATNTTTDGTSVSVPAAALASGKLLRITAGGTITGANAAKSVILYIDDAAILTLTTTTAAAGNWKAEFIMALYTDAAHQKCFGTLVAGAATGATAADVKTVYAADTTDFASAKTVKLQLVSGNGGDTIVQEYGLVEFLP